MYVPIQGYCHPTDTLLSGRLWEPPLFTHAASSGALQAGIAPTAVLHICPGHKIDGCQAPRLSGPVPRCRTCSRGCQTVRDRGVHPHPGVREGLPVEARYEELEVGPEVGAPLPSEEMQGNPGGWRGGGGQGLGVWQPRSC